MFNRNQTKYMKHFTLLVTFLLPLIVSAQFTGRVVNDNNEPVPFASVKVKNTSTGTVTDSVGRFSFIVNQPFPFTLIVSSAGFGQREFIVRNANNNNILVQLESLFEKAQRSVAGCSHSHFSY